MAEYVTVARDEEVGRYGHRVQVNGRSIAIFRVGDALHAIDDECPHYGASLSDGTLHGTSSGIVVMCPWHCWTFKLTDGQCLTMPGYDVRVYSVRVVDGEVQVAITDG